jgi:competence protein ComEC
MKLKSAVVGFAYLAGLICAFLAGGGSADGYIMFAVCLLLGFFLLFLKKRSVGVFTIVFGIAFGVYGFYRTGSMEHVHELDGEIREITGIIVDKNSPAHDMAGFTIEAIIDGMKTRFSLYAPDSGAEVGDTVRFEAKLTLLRDNTAFAEASYYMSRGVFLKASARSSLIVEKKGGLTPLDVIRGFNTHIKNKIMTAFPNDTGALVCAVFLGDRSWLSPELSRNIQRAGIAHYTAVSGLHMTLMAHMFMSVFSLTRLRVMRKLKFTLLAFMTFTFMVFFNLSPSVTRAGIMLVIFYGGELFMRRGSKLNSIGFGVLVILLASPYAALDAGLLLSIAGTVGIGVFAPALNARFTSQRFKAVREALVANLCANYTTLPLVVIYFGGASLVSFITSMILLPFFTVMLTAMVFFAVTAGFDGLSLFIAGIMSRTMEFIITFFGGLKFAYLPLDYGFAIPWIAAAVLLVSITGLLYRRISPCVKAAALSLFALAAMVVSTEYMNLGRTRLSFYTDGGSACVFLRKDNHSVVIVTDDGARAASAALDFISDNFLDEAGLLVVLNSTNNSLPYFEAIPALAFVPPDSVGAFDIGGKFEVTVDRNNAVIVYDDISINIGHIRASSNADINITYSFSVHAGARDGLVLHTSRRSEAEAAHEFNVYYDRFNLFLN